MPAEFVILAKCQTDPSQEPSIHPGPDINSSAFLNDETRLVPLDGQLSIEVAVVQLPVLHGNGVWAIIFKQIGIESK